MSDSKEYEVVLSDKLTCSKCHSVLPAANFYVSKAGKVDYYCKSCRKGYYKAKSEEISIAPAEFSAMLTEQGGKCGVCREAGGRLQVDNDPDGKPRGLVCKKCYTALKEAPGFAKIIRYYLALVKAGKVKS
jgi:Recombination endonuclease VII